MAVGAFLPPLIRRSRRFFCGRRFLLLPVAASDRRIIVGVISNVLVLVLYFSLFGVVGVRARLGEIGGE